MPEMAMTRQQDSFEKPKKKSEKPLDAQDVTLKMRKKIRPTLLFPASARPIFRVRELNL